MRKIKNRKNTMKPASCLDTAADIRDFSGDINQNKSKWSKLLNTELNVTDLRALRQCKCTV